MGRTIRPHNMAGSPILVTEHILEYRHCITQHVTAEDVVVEVGCAEGLTTALIARQAGRVFGIDKSPSQVAKAISRHQQQHPNLTFHQVDAWDLNSVLKLAAGAGVGGFTVVFIDVSGSRRVGDVENLLMKYEQVFNPRLFVVKSYHLKRLINRCQLYYCPSTPHSGQQQHGLEAASAEAISQQDAAGDVADAAGGAAGTQCGHGQQQEQQQQQQHIADTASHCPSSATETLRPQAHQQQMVAGGAAAVDEGPV